MNKISKTLLALASISIAFQLTVTAAPAKIEEPLKLYPISSKTYNSLLEIITKQQSTPEVRMLEARHLTITPWTVSLPQSWNGGLTIDNMPLSVGHKPIRGYPLCVLKVNGTRGGKRGNRRGRQYEDTYAGLAPTVVYTPPGYPEYAYGPPGYEHHPPGYEHPTHRPPGHEHPTHRPPGHGHPTHRPQHPDHVITIPGIGKYGQKALVNCVLVLHGGKRYPKPTTTTTPKPDKIVPPYGYPFPHPPPPFGYYPPPYGYPPYGYPGPYPPPPPPQTFPPKPDVRNLDDNQEQMDSAMFQKMLDEYYPPLGDLYAVHSSANNAEIELADGGDSSVEDSKESHDNYF